MSISKNTTTVVVRTDYGSIEFEIMSNNVKVTWKNTMAGYDKPDVLRDTCWITTGDLAELGKLAEAHKK